MWNVSISRNLLFFGIGCRALIEPVNWVLRVGPKLVSESENSKIGPKEYVLKFCLKGPLKKNKFLRLS